MENKFIVSSSPHIKTKCTTRKIMLDVVIALMPATIAGCVLFGWSALVTLLLSVAGAVITELVYSLAMKKSFGKIVEDFDFTSVVTGLLLGLTLPALPLDKTFPWYMPLLGGIFAIAVVKMLFGGTGKNIVNPAIAGRIFLFLSFSSFMVKWVAPNFMPDNSVVSGTAGSIITGSTHLTTILQTGSVANISNLDLFLGIGVAGCIGETCKLALLIGFVYLIVKKVIDWKLPLIYIVTTGLMAVIYHKSFQFFLPAILSGGLFLGAIFMATDYVTSPNTLLGNIIYFFLLGVLTGVLREATKMEVVSFVILLMNLVVPLFNTYLRYKPFGYKRPAKQKKDKGGELA